VEAPLSDVAHAPARRDTSRGSRGSAAATPPRAHSAGVPALPKSLPSSARSASSAVAAAERSTPQRSAAGIAAEALKKAALDDLLSKALRAPSIPASGASNGYPGSAASTPQSNAGYPGAGGVGYPAMLARALEAEAVDTESVAGSADEPPCLSFTEVQSESFRTSGRDSSCKNTVYNMVTDATQHMAAMALDFAVGRGGSASGLSTPSSKQRLAFNAPPRTLSSASSTPSSKSTVAAAAEVSASLEEGVKLMLSQIERGPELDFSVVESTSAATSSRVPTPEVVEEATKGIANAVLQNIADVSLTGKSMPVGPQLFKPPRVPHLTTGVGPHAGSQLDAFSALSSFRSQPTSCRSLGGSTGSASHRLGGLTSGRSAGPSQSEVEAQTAAREALQRLQRALDSSPV